MPVPSTHARSQRSRNPASNPVFAAVITRLITVPIARAIPTAKTTGAKAKGSRFIVASAPSLARRGAPRYVRPMAADTLTLPLPDDWHVHLRDGAALATTVPATARTFGRAIVMPNLRPPVRTGPEADAYRARIAAHIPPGSGFSPLMTLYLTDTSDPAAVVAAFAAGQAVAVKLYPAGATTHSDAGLTAIRKADAVLHAMEEAGMPLLLHGEVTDSAVDIFDREAVFVDTVLAPLLQRHPRLKVVLEHVTTAHAIAFVLDGPPTLAATLTAHHLLVNRNAMFQGGLRPHHYCLPVLKRERDRAALLAAATSGHPRVFLGSDSAPHETTTKESACGCAGCFTAHAALELYAEAFDSVGALHRLPAFASENGPRFYGLPVNPGTVTLRREEWPSPGAVPYLGGTLTPWRTDEPLRWRATRDTPPA